VLINDAIWGALGFKFEKLIKNRVKEASNKGIAWIHPNYRDGKLVFEKYKSEECIPIYDNETQDYIHHSIKKIRKDYTIIIIAHRLSTVIDCDKILVVDDGKIVGFDTHENLIKTNKVYKRLYKKELI